MPCLLYACLCPLMFLLTRAFPKRLIIFFGLFGLGIANFMIGTSPYLGLDRNSTTIMIGLILLGFSAPMISIPVLPDMLESIEVAEDLNYDMEEVNNYIASIFTCCSGIGEAIGPMASSVLKKLYGFEHS